MVLFAALHMSAYVQVFGRRRFPGGPGRDELPLARPGLLGGGRPGLAPAGAAFHAVNKHRHGLWPRSVMQFE